MLLSSGGFAVYLTESNVFSLLAQRFGNLERVANRRRLIQAWLGSKLFGASGLEAASVEERILRECGHYGDFLRITMEEIARTQAMTRWAENTPEHILYAPLIKALIPNALFIHMIRDGRAVALSLDRRSDRGLHALPWDRRHNLLVQGMYWDWMVRGGRARGRTLGADYMEVRFENLVRDPRQTLSSIGKFVAHDLDYDRIRQTGYRTVRDPNTSFRNEGNFDPLERWRTTIRQDQLAALEGIIGDLLRQLGYPLLTSGRLVGKLRRLRDFYRTYFGVRFWFKTSWFGGVLRPRLTSRQLDEIVMGEDRPALRPAEKQ